MKKYLIGAILLIVLTAIVCGVCGCASLEYTNPQGEHLKYTAVFREIKADPNGAVEIKTSSAVEPVAAGFFGFLAGMWAL